MIQPKKKICDGENCKELKIIWKRHEGKKYCKECWMRIKSKELAANSSKVKPTNNNKKQYFLPPRSEKRSKEERIYQAKRLIFLSRNPMCKMAIPGLCLGKANTIQHLKGRVGELFLDESEWIPACWPCHQYADTHPEEAIEKGWAKLRLTSKENE